MNMSKISHWNSYLSVGVTIEFIYKGLTLSYYDWCIQPIETTPFMCHRFVIQHFTLINHNNQPNFVKGITYIEQIKNQNHN